MTARDALAVKLLGEILSVSAFFLAHKLNDGINLKKQQARMWLNKRLRKSYSSWNIYGLYMSGNSSCSHPDPEECFWEGKVPTRWALKRLQNHVFLGKTYVRESSKAQQLGQNKNTRNYEIVPKRYICFKTQVNVFDRAKYPHDGH